MICLILMWHDDLIILMKVYVTKFFLVFIHMDFEAQSSSVLSASMILTVFDKSVFRLDILVTLYVRLINLYYYQKPIYYSICSINLKHIKGQSNEIFDSHFFIKRLILVPIYKPRSDFEFRLIFVE